MVTPVLDHPCSEEIFPDTQPKSPLVQLGPVCSFPVPCCLEAKPEPHLAAPSSQGVVESVCFSVSWGILFITSSVGLIKLPLPFLIKPASLLLDVSNKAISRQYQHICVPEPEIASLFAYKKTKLMEKDI